MPLRPIVLLFTLIYISFQFAKASDERRFVIRLKDSKTKSKALKAFKKANISLVKEIAELDVLVVHDEQKNLNKLYSSLKNDILYVEKDVLAHTNATPNDYYYSYQGPLRRISPQAAWDISTGNSNVVLAISDSGIQQDHSDLEENIWINSAEIPDNGVDDDNNGFIDDVYGWDFINNDNDASDDNSHGSHVAGIAGAKGNNDEGIAGVQWKAKLMNLKWLGDDGRGWFSDAAQTILYAANNGAHVLNASWGGESPSKILEDAITYAATKNLLIVAAAGNDSANLLKEPHYPGAYRFSNLITVASSRAHGILSSFSNWGDGLVALAAPGSDVLSTGMDNDYIYKNGTSMATPMVVGVAALILAKHPNLTYTQLKNALLNAVDYKLKSGGYEGLVSTSGELNAEKALTQFNGEFEAWPSRISIQAGESFQFTNSLNKNVTWSLTAEELGSIDSQGVFRAKEDSEGVVGVMAFDSVSNQYSAIADVRVFKNANKKPSPPGGGCTKEAQADDGNSSSSSPWGALSYAFLFVCYLIHRRQLRKRNRS